MEKEAKDRTLIILLVIAIIQGPILYYLFDNFFGLIFAMIFGLTGLVLTVFLFLDLIRHKSTTRLYHVVGLVLAFSIGLFTIKGDLIEYLDFNLRKAERNKIVDEVKKGKLKSGYLSINSFLPISKDGEINIKSNVNGIVSIEFYISLGIIGHYSAFLYTNDPNEVRELANEASSYKKLDDNWYRISY